MPGALSVKIQDVRGEFSRTFKVTGFGNRS